MKKLQPMTEKELRIQTAIGSLDEEYRNNLCRYKTPEVSKGLRTCSLCGLKCIHKGEEFYLIYTEKSWDGRSVNTYNICKTCSWLSIQTINRIINEYNQQEEETGEKR